MRGAIVGVPIVKIVVFWGLYWGPLIYGNYHVSNPNGYPVSSAPPSTCKGSVFEQGSLTAIPLIGIGSSPHQDSIGQ